MIDVDATIFDLVVVGSGAAGLMAALTAAELGQRVAVLEADGFLGGATALSEGMIWVPNNSEALGLTDAPDTADEAAAALAYLRAISGNFFDQDRAQAYVDLAPRVLALASRAAGLQFTLNHGSRDYYPDAVGATLGRRALNPVPAVMRGMDRRLFARLRRPLGTMMVLGGIGIASRDAPDYQTLGRSPAAMVRVAGHVLRYAADRMLGWPRGTRLANGNVIVASLAEAVCRRGGVILTDWAVESLWLKGGRVAGVIGPRGRISARLGVVLASGWLNAVPASRTALVGHQPHIAIPAQAPVLTLERLVAGTGGTIVAEVSQPVLWAPA